jgi:LPXTG-site transpeptidase (sortase) family protein
LPLTDTGFAADWLGKDAGLLQGSNLPGEGISIIAAHNHLSTGETGPFLFLMDLQQKDRIFIRKTGGEMLSYAVYANIRITPDEVEKLDELAKTDCLILVTCEDQSIDGGYAYRRVVFAEPFETK